MRSLVGVSQREWEKNSKLLPESDRQAIAAVNKIDAPAAHALANGVGSLVDSGATDGQVEDAVKAVLALIHVYRRQRADA